MSGLDLDLAFGLAVVTLTIKILSEFVRCRKLIFGMDINKVSWYAVSWWDLDLTFDLAVVTVNVKSVRTISQKL